MAGLNVHVYPSVYAGGSRVIKLAKSIQAESTYDRTEIVGIHAGTYPQRAEVAPGVSVVRIAGSSRTSDLGRLLKVLLWQPRVYWQYRRSDIRTIAAHNLWVLPLCWLLSRATKANFVYNPHELETESISMRGIRQRVARIVERHFIAKASLVSVVNESIADWYVDRYSIDRPFVVGNVPVVKEYDVQLRRDLGIAAGDMLYIHTGFLAQARSIPLILNTFAERPGKHVVFFGEGELQPLVEDFAGQYCNIHLCEPVAPDQIVANVRQADVGLCLIEPVSMSDRLSSPNKLMESLAADTPPLCAELAEARAYLGPLAGRWVLADVQNELGPAIDAITKEDVREFRNQWRGVQQWPEIVAPFVRAYANLK